jgi:hypothetical protein
VISDLIVMSRMSVSRICRASIVSANRRSSTARSVADELCLGFAREK